MASPTDSQPGRSESAVLKTLLITDLVDSTKLTEQIGDERTAEIFRRHDRIARDLLAANQGREADRTDGFLLLFDRPINAVSFALAFHRGMARLSAEMSTPLLSRIGIHLGEVVLIETPAEDLARGAKPLEVEGLAKPTAARLMSLAMGGQTLLSRGAFELARRGAVGAEADGPTLRWVAHGRYRLKGVAEPMEVYEVGVEGEAPLSAPLDTEKVHRVPEEGTVLGWRPAVGLEVPRRPSWVLDSRLGEGGFGEVWLAHHTKTERRRVFKFCFDLERSRALKREITIFRYLYDRLRDRDDIARIVDWQLEESPYFIEAEYSAGGSLLDWTKSQGGIERVPLETRLEIVALAAEALAAAHSAGVLHQDVKPANILIAFDRDGRPRAQLSDFGIGLITDNDHLAAVGITVAGLTEPATPEGGYSRAGTRLYTAPELLEGKEATVQADIYALGVVLYQMVVGDLTRALAPGWERSVDDELLREDIAFAVDGSPRRRLGNALRLAEGLRGLPQRRAERAAERARAQEAEQAQTALAKARRRRKFVVAAMTILVLVAGSMSFLARRIYLEKQRADRERKAAEEVSDFLVKLFEVSDPERERGGTTTARELLDSGAERIRDRLTDQPEVQGRLKAVIGKVYRNFGLYPEAEPLLLDAVATHEKLGEESAQLAYSLNELGILYGNQGHFEKAQPLFERSLALREQLHGRNSSEIAGSLINLAGSYRRQGKLAQAQPLLERAIGILRRSEQAEAVEQSELASALNILGNVCFGLDQLSAAEGHWRQSLGLFEQSLSPDHPQVATVLSNLGALFRRQARYADAEPLYRRALEIHAKALGDSSPDVAADLHDLANLYLEWKKYAQAEPLYQRVLALRQALFGKEHPVLITSCRDYAELLRALGRDAEAAALEAQAQAIEETSALSDP